MFDLSRKTAVITGAASGIGKAIATVLAARGAEVIIFDLNEEAAAQTVAEITESGGNCRAVTADVSDLEQIKSRIAAIETESQVDLLINNAGIGHVGTAENTGPDYFDRLMTINVKGYYHMIHAVLPYMIKRAAGVILNIASVAGTVGISERFAYSVTKGAVLAMTRSVAKDFIRHGIRCNSISPGRVHTPFVDGYLAKNYPGREAEVFAQLEKTQPLGRMGKPVEIAYLALYLCCEESAFVTGTDFPIDGGFITLNS
ncbi:MAG TPA: glucose 1-dehydrogenase [Saprospiraceae bacterium]|nr:glucose 1-dehydrogenase [Saprospiraceae bacterium]HNT21973.1 glucose 1-dehydrogenase [Saprospiraceae bacterium]